MTLSLGLRQRALELAVDARQLNDAPGSIVAAAEKFLNFLEGIAREAAKEGLAAHDEAAAKQAEKAAKKARGYGGGGGGGCGGVAVTTPAEAAAISTQQPVGQNQNMTLDDVRNALVQLQTRKSREASLEILAKYTKPAAAVTGNLKAEQYGKLIAELNAA
jgi:hypothetical protein